MQNKRDETHPSFILDHHRPRSTFFKNMRPDADLRWFKVPAYLLFLTLLTLFVVIHFEHYSYCYLQEKTFLFLNTTFNYLPSNFWATTTLMGDASLLIPFLSIFIRNNATAWIAMLSSAITAGVISGLSKLLFNTPRPAAFIDHKSFTILGDVLNKYSLPSGHTMTAFTGIFTLIILYYPSAKRPQNILVICLAIFFATLVGLSRIAVGAHWPIDVWVGAMLGWIAAFIGVGIAQSFSDQSYQNFKPYINLFTTFLLLSMCLHSLSILMTGTTSFIAYGISILCGVTTILVVTYIRLGSDMDINQAITQKTFRHALVYNHVIRK